MFQIYFLFRNSSTTKEVQDKLFNDTFKYDRVHQLGVVVSVIIINMMFILVYIHNDVLNVKF